MAPVLNIANIAYTYPGQWSRSLAIYDYIVVGAISV